MPRHTDEQLNELAEKICMDDLCANTDVEIFCDDAEDHYSPSMYKTVAGGIGINVGGCVIVKTLREWHGLADGKIEQWVDVREKLPMENSCYLVAIEYRQGRIVKSCYIDGRVFCTNGRVTHWMPLPEPPNASSPQSRRDEADSC